MTRGNLTLLSDSMKDNPHMHYYARIYALSMALMLILKAVRGVVFVKVDVQPPHLETRDVGLPLEALKPSAGPGCSDRGPLSVTEKCLVPLLSVL